MTLSFIVALQASDAVDGALKRVAWEPTNQSRARVLVVARRVDMEKLGGISKAPLK